MRFEEIPDNLINKAREGHPDALEELCLMVQPGAYAVLLSLLRNHDDACDALQEALLRVIRHLPRLRDVNAFPGWLMRLLVNQANDNFRKHSSPVIDITTIDERSAENTIAPTASAPLSPRRSAENHEIYKRINSALHLLTERQKNALILFEMEGLSLREVAEAMELSEGAVKFHLHEARKNLRVELQKLGVDNAYLFEASETR